MCSQKSYDFILQDFHLGDGKKNGQQVLEDLMIEKLISHESVFVMVTAETSQAMVLSALEHEPDAYLTKPFNRSGLAQRLERLVQRKTLLKPILQALDRGKPLEVLNACISLCKQDIRYSPLCLRYRADALRDLNQNEALERLYDSIIADRPLPWAFAGLGKLLFKRGQITQAKGVYEKALKVFPMMPALYDGMADVLVAEGDTRGAQRVLEDAIRLSPLAVRRQAQLGKLAMVNEDFETASKAYRQAVAQGAQSRFKDAESNQQRQREGVGYSHPTGDQHHAERRSEGQPVRPRSADPCATDEGDQPVAQRCRNCRKTHRASHAAARWHGAVHEC
jgi:tetratricopeptide (TPR) repeat protein